MSAQLLSNLQNFKQAIIQPFGRRFVEEYGEGAVLAVEVRDPIHCRVFELDAFYEFTDYKTIDLDNIDMTINIQAKAADSAIAANLAGFRLASYPETIGVFSILTYNGPAEIIAATIPLLEDLIRSLQGKVIITSGVTSKSSLSAWINSEYKLMFEIPGTKTHFLHKII